MEGDGSSDEHRSEEHTGPVEPLLPGVLIGRLAELAEELRGAHRDMGWWRAGAPELSRALKELDSVRQAVDMMRTSVAREVESRGVHQDAKFSLVDFLGTRSPWLSRGELTALARTAERLREAKNASVAKAVEAGELSVQRADVLLTALKRLAPFVDPQTYVSHVELLLPLAQMGVDKELRAATEHLVALATPELPAEQLAKARRDSCKVFESSLSGGMRRFIVEADPEGAAMLDAVFGSVLTKPLPGPNGEPDDRSAGQRRYDALLTVVGRGMSHPEGVPTSSKVSLMVTVDYDVTAERVGRTGQGVGGPGQSFFTAGQVRRMACEAGIIPAVLGGPSQLLDHGRTRRLASPAQLRALYRRDRGCTFPGCSMPARWTEAHHADVWWARGGRTDLLSLALVCGRHHTWIHAWDPEVTITPHGVTWHLDRLRGNGFTRARLHTDGTSSDRVAGGSCGPTSEQPLPLDADDMPADADQEAPGWAGLLGSCPTGAEETEDRSVSGQGPGRPGTATHQHRTRVSRRHGKQTSRRAGADPTLACEVRRQREVVVVGDEDWERLVGNMHHRAPPGQAASSGSSPANGAIRSSPPVLVAIDDPPILRPAAPAPTIERRHRPVRTHLPVQVRGPPHGRPFGGERATVTRRRRRSRGRAGAAS